MYVCIQTTSKDFSGTIHPSSNYLEYAFVTFLCIYSFCILAMIRKYCFIPSCSGKERKALYACREVCDPACMVSGRCTDFCFSCNYVLGELIKCIMLGHFSLLISHGGAAVGRQTSSLVRSRPKRRPKFQGSNGTLLKCRSLNLGDGEMQWFWVQ